MLIAETPFFFPSSSARARRLKLSSAYQQRTSSRSSWKSGRARPLKNPRACEDHGTLAIPVFTCHDRNAGSDDARHPPHGASTIRARLKLLLTAENPCSPLALA